MLKVSLESKLTTCGAMGYFALASTRCTWTALHWPPHGASTIASLQQLPATLGKQTSQYIEKGVRASIKEDLKWPIEDARKGPIGELHYATTQARDVMREVRSESKLQSWTTVALMVVLGIALGMGGSYFFFIRDLGNINDRLEIIQQQIATPAPVPEAKPAAKQGKPHQSH